MSRAKKPAFVVREGSASVTGYKLKRRGRFCLVYRKHAGAGRTREEKTGEQAARRRAREIARALANGRAEVLELTLTDRESYLHARSMIPDGLPLHVVVEEWKNFRESNEQGRRRECPATALLVSELLDWISDRPRSPRYLKPLKRDLDKFAARFPKLESATADKIKAWLRELELGPRRRDNIRAGVVRLSRFAREKGYLDDVKTEAEKVERIWQGSEVETFTPAEVATLLAHIKPRWRPWLLIGAYAGLRTTEIFRLDWSAIKFDQSVIAVKSSVARKIRISRLVPLLPNLAAWLAPYRAHAGRIYPNDNEKSLERGLEKEIARLAGEKVAGIKWKRNGLRHSYGSHRLAVVKNIAQLALEMGNSPGRIRENYNDPKSAAEGELYFSHFPPEAIRNVLPGEFGA